MEIKKTYDKNVDIINLHRIAFESFSRFVLQGPKRAQEVIDEGLQFVFDTLKVFNNEVDLIVMGFRLLAELALWLGPKKKEVIVCLLDCIQFYSPPSPVHRPRQIPRHNIKPVKSNMLKLLGCSLTHSLIHSFTHSLIHSSLTSYSLTHVLLTLFLLTHSLAHS